MAALASALAERGELVSSDVTSTLTQATYGAMGRWLDRTFGGLRFFEFSASLHASVADACGEDADQILCAWGKERVKTVFGEGCGVDPFKPHVAVSLTVETSHNVLVGAEVEALEAEVPGLGWSALKAITAATAQYDLFGFSFFQWAASYCYWGGCEDEKECYESMGESLDEYEGMTRDELEEIIPIRAFAKAKPLSRAALQTVQRGGSVKAARVASLILKLQGLGKVQQPFHMGTLSAEFDWYETLTPTVIMGWKQMGDLMAVADDFGNYVMEGGGGLREMVGLVGIEVDAPKCLAKKELEWKKAARQLKLADELLSEVAVEV
jgi:PRTRC genetic system protein F